MGKKRKTSITLDDYIKSMKKGNREAERELLGPGFHSRDRVHRSSKIYSRKQKHKGNAID